MNDNKKYRCVDCLSLFDDAQLKSDMLFCPSCGGHLEEGIFKEANASQDDKRQHQDTDDLLFECLSCSKTIRLTFPFKASGFRCPSCQDKYVIHTLPAQSPIFVIVPMAHRRQSAESPPKPPEMPLAVKNAIRLFELDNSASFEDIKAAYRKCMSQYHPDKVHHLGLDLRRLAEAKTKEYNLAFETIQHFFQSR